MSRQRRKERDERKKKEREDMKDMKFFVTTDKETLERYGEKGLEFQAEMSFQQDLTDKLIAVITPYGGGTKRVIVQRNMEIVSQHPDLESAPKCASYFALMLSAKTFMLTNRIWLINPASVPTTSGEMPSLEVFWTDESGELHKATMGEDYENGFEMRPAELGR